MPDPSQDPALIRAGGRLAGVRPVRRRVTGLAGCIEIMNACADCLRILYGAGVLGPGTSRSLPFPPFPASFARSLCQESWAREDDSMTALVARGLI